MYFEVIMSVVTYNLPVRKSNRILIICNRCKRLNKLKNAKKKLMKRKDPDRKSMSLPDLTSSIKPRLNGIPRTHQPELDKM